MSSGDDNPVARWSRRKRSARKGDPANLREPDVHAAPVRRQAVEAQAADDDVSAPLPSLDDLTAESDLTPFLRNDVPEQLKKAALRKMWSLDPAIRDHVGLAENDWDFNCPDSIPGFGSSVASDAAPNVFSTPAALPSLDPNAPAASVRAPEIPGSQPRTEQAFDASCSEPGLEAEDVKDESSSGAARSAVSSRHGGALPRE